MKPLAERVRPTSIEQFQGQEHLLGEAGALRPLLASKRIPSIIFWGPPGIGKTTMARLLAEAMGHSLYSLSAVSAGVKEVRDIIVKAKAASASITVFIDEIHRFSKNQQDVLLGAVEEGIITLIGATTENPSFEVIAPLLSRVQVYILNPLTPEQLLAIIHQAIARDEVLSTLDIRLEETDALLRLAGSDARRALNILDLVVSTAQDEPIIITNDRVQAQTHQKLALYDKDGSWHYETISAFIKSMRGSDPNAAVYYLARMIEAGEDPLFIARRMVILASEDIGNANPQALMLATSCFQTVQFVGMPEGRIILGQCATYLACSPKSNASYKAIDMAIEVCRNTGDLPIPMHLRNATTHLQRDLGYGQGYQYAHNFENQFTDLEFLPEALVGQKFYDPQGNSKWEQATREFLRTRWHKKYNY